MLEKGGISADEIDFIIVATITPDSMMPSTAARVQANIGAKNAFAFDLTAACSGFIFALSTGEKFISSGRYKKVWSLEVKPYQRLWIGQIVRLRYCLVTVLAVFYLKLQKDSILG